MDEEISREALSSFLTVRISVSPDLLAVPGQTLQPFLVAAHRSSFLPFAVEAARKHFDNFIHKAGSQIVWVEEVPDPSRPRRIVLKPHIPTGVLYDLAGRPPGPWQLQLAPGVKSPDGTHELAPQACMLTRAMHNIKEVRRSTRHPHAAGHLPPRWEHAAVQRRDQRRRRRAEGRHGVAYVGGGDAVMPLGAT
jgi:hypothetical protein